MKAATPIRVYLDTSVIGGYFDAEFAADTKALFGTFRKGLAEGVLSEMTANEIARAPRHIVQLFHRMGATCREHLEVREQEVFLQQAYLERGVLGPRWQDDAMHVALATIARVDVLATWNFKHMIAPSRSRLFSAVNIALGYGIITIMSPTEIIRTLRVTE